MKRLSVLVRSKRAASAGTSCLDDLDRWWMRGSYGNDMVYFKFDSLIKHFTNRDRDPNPYLCPSSS